MTRTQAGIKRGFDLILSGIGLVLLSPVIALTALAVLASSPGPALYLSQRLGLHGRPFVLYKFRTMYTDSQPRYHADGSMLVEKNDARVTRVGRVLRAGFDELPQLWNVLKGDMSLVGPRPDPLYALNLYDSDERLRLTVRPGITGLAQVNGRTDIPWRDRLALDVKYVRNYSLRLDARIALATLVELIPSLRRLSGDSQSP